MEDRAVPVKDEILLGTLRLPKKYEKCVKDPKYHVLNKKSAIANTREENNDSKIQDMLQAIMWIKQELILMKQHDILLKRQFSDIQDTINTLNKVRKHRTKGAVTDSNTSLHSTEGSDLVMDNYSVRSASSVTALTGTDSDSDDDELARPRTCSMMTTRDLTALARRRGSKELI